MVSDWSAQPQRPPKAPAELVPLAPKGLKRNWEEQYPITVNSARAAREPVWATDWHMSFRGGKGAVTVGRGHEDRNVRCRPTKPSQPFPVHLHHPTPALGRRKATSISLHLCRERPRKTHNGQIQGTCQQETKRVTTSRSVCLLF